MKRNLQIFCPQMSWKYKTDEFSLISDQIHELLRGKLVNQIEIKFTPQEFFLECSFNWDRIKNFLVENDVDIHSDNFSYDYCLKCCQVLHPILKYCNNFSNELLIENIIKCTMWKSHSSEILELLFENHSETSNMEGILYLTAILENILGNFYFTLTQLHPPHLLRDLLKIKELNEYFGSFTMYFLRLIIGTPNSINLRNIVWHGFPNLKEIPEYFFSVLLVAMISFSQIYEKNPIKIKCREKVKDIKKYFELTDDQFTEFELEIRDKEKIRKIFQNSKYCPKSHIIYWETIYKYYLKSDNKKFIILILPQIELTLRLLYSEFNNYDVSAKIDEYYITMDSIFEYKVPNNSIDNLLFSDELNENILKLSYDLFISPHGPRIRDKISHGEVDLNCIDQKTSLIIFISSLTLLGNSNEKLTNFINNYESKFHINAIFQKNFKISWNYYKKTNEFLKSKLCTNNSFDHEIVNKICESIEKLLLPHKLRVFKRHCEEKKIIGFLNRIILNIKTICENLLESYENKLQLLNDRQLRSRERKTLQSMIEMYPNLELNLHLMFESTSTMFLKLQEDLEFTWIETFSEKSIRFLKIFLKTVENLVQTSNLSKNKIDKSYLICNNFNYNLIKFKQECDCDFSTLE